PLSSTPPPSTTPFRPPGLRVPCRPRTPTSPRPHLAHCHRPPHSRCRLRQSLCRFHPCHRRRDQTRVLFPPGHARAHLCHLLLPGSFPRRGSSAAFCWDLQRIRGTSRPARRAPLRSIAPPP